MDASFLVVHGLGLFGPFASSGFSVLMRRTVAAAARQCEIVCCDTPVSRDALRAGTLRPGQPLLLPIAAPRCSSSRRRPVVELGRGNLTRLPHYVYCLEKSIMESLMLKQSYLTSDDDSGDDLVHVCEWLNPAESGQSTGMLVDVSPPICVTDITGRVIEHRRVVLMPKWIGTSINDAQHRPLAVRVLGNMCNNVDAATEQERCIMWGRLFSSIELAQQAIDARNNG